MLYWCVPQCPTHSSESQVHVDVGSRDHAPCTASTCDPPHRRAKRADVSLEESQGLRGVWHLVPLLSRQYRLLLHPLFFIFIFLIFRLSAKTRLKIVTMKSVSLVHLSIALLILLISFPSVFVVAQLKDEIKTSDKDREKPDDVMDTTTVAPVTAAPVATPKPFCSTEAPVKDVTGKPVSLRPVVISTDALKYTETPITPVSAAPVVIPDERRSLR